MFPARRSAVTAASTMGALAAALVLTAPAAPAAITGFGMAPGLSFGSAAYGTGCVYLATATATPGEYVSFYDSQQGSFDPPGAIQVGNSGAVTAKWTPHTPGVHHVHAVQIGSQRTLQLTVGTGLNLGFACLVR